MLPKAIAYVKLHDKQTKWMYFLIEDDDDKVSADIKKILIASLSTKKYLKTKIKFNGNEVTDFYVKKSLKVNSNHTCLAVFSLDSVLKKGHNYYPHMF